MWIYMYERVYVYMINERVKFHSHYDTFYQINVDILFFFFHCSTINTSRIICMWWIEGKDNQSWLILIVLTFNIPNPKTPPTTWDKRYTKPSGIVFIPSTTDPTVMAGLMWAKLMWPRDWKKAENRLSGRCLVFLKRLIFHS